MTMKSMVLRAVDSLGYTLTPKWRESNLALATLTRELIDTHAIDCVIDVGANEGQYRKFIRYEVEFDGLVISYEPQPELVGTLRAAGADDKSWQIHNFALGAQETELTLNVMERNTFSSFLEPDNSATPQFEAPNRVKGQHKVPVRRLDAQPLPPSCERVFLKCDTQGFDMEVIKGASAILPRVAAIQMELGLTRIYHGLRPYHEVLSELDGLGFQPAGFFPVSRNRNLSAIEFDCVLVNMRY
ncbi:MAG: FkbM family methyltransferase [Rubrivivax sp.]